MNEETDIARYIVMEILNHTSANLVQRRGDFMLLTVLLDFTKIFLYRSFSL